ncbi:hypothetical protein HNQ51_000495 [Inhella inkyongensis]|uniref:Signal transduction histidine kinase internal region domain-containing protein n=1 Tax=Inhella inkyongensis TaxID=392593 RepID=A0A840S108_9BURK|nr:histidine kinase [Inhella inkyongensis]MBB5203202.1 hypothetical protein [Inhella inkyongensis]
MSAMTGATRAPQSPLLGVGAVMLGWSLVAVVLALSRSADLVRAGKDASLWLAWWGAWPSLLPHMVYSGLVAWILRTRPDLLQRPARLLLWGLLLTPLYAVLIRPLWLAIRFSTRGGDWSTYGAQLVAPQRTDLWLLSVVMLAGLAVQLSLAWLAHSRAQEEEALRVDEANLQLRLQLLQGQLEPHFMFNTLNSIAALVRGAEREVALGALTRLSELLRYSLRASQQQWVSVADELRFVDDYVALQRLRFGDALQWQAEVQPDEWSRWACPPLLLQPLVENAVRYGLESGEPGVIRFSVQGHAKRLQIELDNPRSADAHLMAGHGVGLSKTRERVQMLYGSQASLSTDAQPHHFHLTLNLPLRDLDGTLESSDR